MCLIIASHNGELPPNSLVENAYLDNKDGWGLVYGKSLCVRKGMDLPGAKKAIALAKGQPYIMHFRWATHGSVNAANTHPFRVSRKAYMAHNGVLGVDIKHPEFSDTWHLARILEEIGFRPDWTKCEQWIKDMEEYVGPSNKLSFLTRDGLSIVNEGMGKWHGGYWLSNEHSSWGGARWPKDWWKSSKAQSMAYEECDYCRLPFDELFPVTGGLRLCEDCHRWHMIEEMEDRKTYGEIFS